MQVRESIFVHGIDPENAFVLCNALVEIGELLFVVFCRDERKFDRSIGIVGSFDDFFAEHRQGCISFVARSNRLCQFDDFVVGWICHESFLDESEGLIGVVEDFVGDVSGFDIERTLVEFVLSHIDLSFADAHVFGIAMILFVDRDEDRCDFVDEFFFFEKFLQHIDGGFVLIVIVEDALEDVDSTHIVVYVIDEDMSHIDLSRVFECGIAVIACDVDLGFDDGDEIVVLFGLCIERFESRSDIDIGAILFESASIVLNSFIVVAHFIAIGARDFDENADRIRRTVADIELAIIDIDEGRPIFGLRIESFESIESDGVFGIEVEDFVIGIDRFIDLVERIFLEIGDFVEEIFLIDEIV